MKPCTFQPKPQKTKTFYPEKNPLCFRKWNFLALILKKFLYFRKLNPALPSPSQKKKQKQSTPKKIQKISGNETF